MEEKARTGKWITGIGKREWVKGRESELQSKPSNAVLSDLPVVARFSPRIGLTSILKRRTI